ncbi:NAD-dependent protein deacylase [Salirhabdus salicampi]|uniref:NAD-dependent protein deacylase n=1 Tax=Salirhabdus salicampi TaxID=476102 RepID=UPI0020C59CBF|nr:NAD-dependent protein deacylase [Salirhabdus salicampi]MCP8615783.1 NAD-dependent protein deacylase [Salirhabdus salicampi]
MDKINEIIHKINNSQNIAVLTGAGVSTDSGIPDFRSTGGLWSSGESREYYMSTDYYSKHPMDFWRKYKEIFQMKLAQEYTPNITHSYLKRLEDVGKNVTIITQNVDGLHKKAGSKHVIEYHGTLTTASCPNCSQRYPLSYIMKEEVPYCERCHIPLKPDVILFGDMIQEHEKAEAAINHSNLILVLGTSLLVGPFNLLPELGVIRNIPSILINRESTSKDGLFDIVKLGELKPIMTILNNSLTGES